MCVYSVCVAVYIGGVVVSTYVHRKIESTLVRCPIFIERPSISIMVGIFTVISRWGLSILSGAAASARPLCAAPPCAAAADLRRSGSAPLARGKGQGGYGARGSGRRAQTQCLHTHDRGRTHAPYSPWRTS
jgi:hypothetical protein